MNEIDEIAKVLEDACCYNVKCDDCKYEKYSANICCQTRALYNAGYRKEGVDSYKSGAEDAVRYMHEILLDNNWKMTPMMIGMICRKFGISIERRCD